MSNPNIMPEFNLFPRLQRIGKFLGSLLVPFHTSAEPYMSDHYEHPLDGPMHPVIDWPEREVA